MPLSEQSNSSEKEKRMPNENACIREEHKGIIPFRSKAVVLKRLKRTLNRNDATYNGSLKNTTSNKRVSKQKM